MKYKPIRINVQLLSINKKNDKDAVNKFRHTLISQLPDRKYNFTKESRIRFTGTFGMRKNKDLDNCLKVLFDCFQRRYNFNDRQIYEIHITKQDVKTYSKYNQEFVEWTLERI